jgi:membrane protease YdiL (CAAX protease family)
MYPTFRLLSRRSHNENSWQIGILIYWAVFALPIPIIVLGTDIFGLFSLKGVDALTLVAVSVPVAATVAGRWVMPAARRKTSTEKIVWLGNGLGNGVLEELLWRGMFVSVFPDNILWGFLWPSIWFALWHLAPGSLAKNFRPAVLISGALAFGLCWGLAAFHSQSILLTSASHFLTAVVQLLY